MGQFRGDRPLHCRGRRHETRGGRVAQVRYQGFRERLDERHLPKPRPCAHILRRDPARRRVRNGELSGPRLYPCRYRRVGAYRRRAHGLRPFRHHHKPASHDPDHHGRKDAVLRRICRRPGNALLHAAVRTLGCRQRLRGPAPQNREPEKVSRQLLFSVHISGRDLKVSRRKVQLADAQALYGF